MPGGSTGVRGEIDWSKSWSRVSSNGFEPPLFLKGSENITGESGVGEDHWKLSVLDGSAWIAEGVEGTEEYAFHAESMHSSTKGMASCFTP